MSKRCFSPYYQGDNKKQKLDITTSDHNFPLSQKRDEQKTDNWADDDDDEILLLASQACEDAYNESTLPDYSLCMQPATTSTQLYGDPAPGPSKADEFIFKKPFSHSNNLRLKENLSESSSHLPNASSKIVSKVSEDIILIDKIYKEQDPEYIYKQLLQLQEDNNKLKIENGKILEKCVTKEGEASILRTQLKNCQVAVDNARLERVRAQEKIQTEFTEKMSVVNNEINDLRTQLDFKNLEIISTKERCRMLESTKVKLTQVTVSGNDRTSSHRNNTTVRFTETPTKKSILTNTAAQTEKKTRFVKLNILSYSDPSEKREILPLILEPMSDKQHSLLTYSVKLKNRSNFLHSKRRVFSSLKSISGTSVCIEKTQIKKKSLNCLYEDLSYIATCETDENVDLRYSNIVFQVVEFLIEVSNQLKSISIKFTSAFQREMDEKYIELSLSVPVIKKQDLLKGKALCDNEEAIEARRATAALAFCLDSQKIVEYVIRSIETNPSTSSSQNDIDFLNIICKICNLITDTSTAVLYSGLLLSFILLLKNIWKFVNSSLVRNKLLEISTSIIMSRPVPLICCHVLVILRKLAANSPTLLNYCNSSNSGNLRLDCDQGVLLFKKDSCALQVLLKQIEVALKCMEKQNFIEQTVFTTQNLIGLYSNIENEFNDSLIESNTLRCNCFPSMTQVIVYTLHLCASVLRKLKHSHELKGDLEAICRCGLVILYQWVLRDIEFSSQLGFNEGYYHDFIENCEHMKGVLILDEIQGNMLAELVNTLQSSTDEMASPEPSLQEVWINSFENFTLVD